MMKIAGTTIFPVIVLTTSISVAVAQEVEQRPSMIDHLVYLAPDLKGTSDRIASQLGVQPTLGGKHPGRGTVNALLSLGERQYLEIIAPDPSLSELKGAAKQIAQLEAAEIFSFAIESTDLESLKAKANKLGLKTSQIRPGSRRTPDGDLLKWRTLGIDAPTKYRGLVPFFIDWEETPHPGQTSVQGARLVRMVVTHPEPDGLQSIYRSLGVRVPVRHGDRRSITAEIENGSKKLVLHGSGGQPQ